MAWFGLLGPLVARDHAGNEIDLGGRQPRLMVAMLLAADGRSVSVDAIIDTVWGDHPPLSATGTLQSYVSRLRRRIGDDAPVVFDGAGYRLDLSASELDVRRFEALAGRGRALLDAGDPAAAQVVLCEADALWRGPALGELASFDFAVGLATRLEERRLTATEDRLDAELRLGRHDIAVASLAELVAKHPLRERLREQHALALYRCGRQSEALRAIADAGEVLRDELGVEPGRALQDLELAILRHDRALDLAATVAMPSPGAVPVDGGQPPARAARRDAPSEDPARLVGRDAELAVLLGALDDIATASRIVVIEGEPGMGKTRLAEELRVRAAERGARTVWGRSDEGGAAPALWPWLAPLRALAAWVDDLPVALTELLSGDVPMADGTAESVQFERFVAVAELLEAATRSAPAVVLLDDLQWADATSLELMSFLAARLGTGLLVVATLRQLEVGRSDAVTDTLAAIARSAGSRRIQLRGLDRTDTDALLGALAGRTIEAPAAAAIHDRSEGNPFYAIELARLLAEENDARAEVPGTISDVIRRRVSRLPAPTVELLGVAAVVGREVDLQLLARSAGRGIEEVLDDLDPAVAHRLLVEAADGRPGLRFSHALVREVLLDDLTSLRRSRLHLRVADAIEALGTGVDEVEILADHLWRAASIGAGRRAAEALERAAEVSLRRVSYGAAEDLLMKAVRLRRSTATSQADEEAELATAYRLLEVARARRYFQGANIPEVIGRAKELAERLQRRHVLLDMLWFEWSALATSDRVDEARELAASYAALTCDDPDPDVRAMGLEITGVALWTEGRIAEAVQRFDAAMELVDWHTPPRSAFEAEKRMIVRVFWLWNRVLAGVVEPAEAFADFHALTVDQPDRFVVSSVCGFAATTAVTMGDWEQVQRFVDINHAADPGSQFAFWGGQTMMLAAIVDARTSDVDDALAKFAEGKRRYIEIGARSALSTYEASLAMLVAARGRVDDAARLVASARAELDAYRSTWNAAIVRLAEASVRWAAGDHSAAIELFEDAHAIAVAQGAHGLAARARALVAEAGRAR